MIRILLANSKENNKNSNENTPVDEASKVKESTGDEKANENVKPKAEPTININQNLDPKTTINNDITTEQNSTQAIFLTDTDIENQINDKVPFTDGQLKGMNKKQLYHVLRTLGFANEGKVQGIYEKLIELNNSGDIGGMKDLVTELQGVEGDNMRLKKTGIDDTIETTEANLNETKVSSEENLQNTEKAKLGGSYKDVPANGGQVHHMPANSISPLSKNEGPGIRKDTSDHMDTASWGSSKKAKEYRRVQKELIDQGKFENAQQMDIDNIRELFDDKYDEHIQQMLEYTQTVLINIISKGD